MLATASQRSFTITLASPTLSGRVHRASQRLKDTVYVWLLGAIIGWLEKTKSTDRALIRIHVTLEFRN